jgi:hypothetical protein
VFFILTNYKARKRLWLATFLTGCLVVINLAIYSYAFIYSAPNSGDGFYGSVKDDTNEFIRYGQYVLNRLISCKVE